MADTAGKMAFLQRQSDETRVQFLQTEMDTCFTMVGVAEAEFHSGMKDQGRRSVAHVEHGYATLQRFLSDPKHAAHLSAQQQQQFGQGLQTLRARLDRLKE